MTREFRRRQRREHSTASTEDLGGEHQQFCLSFTSDSATMQKLRHRHVILELLKVQWCHCSLRLPVLQEFGLYEMASGMIDTDDSDRRG